MTDITYGSWMDPTVWLRTKVRIEELSFEVSAIECTVFRVQNHADTILEEETWAYEKKRKPFEEILKKRLIMSYNLHFK